MQVPTSLTLLLAIGALALIFLVVFLLISVARGLGHESNAVGAGGNIQQELRAMDAGYALVPFLRAPVRIDGREATTMELLVFVDEEIQQGQICFGTAGSMQLRRSSDSNYCKQLAEHAEAFFRNLKMEPDRWSFCVAFRGTGCTSAANALTLGGRGDFRPEDLGVAQVLVPLPGPEKPAPEPALVMLGFEWRKP